MGRYPQFRLLAVTFAVIVGVFATAREVDATPILDQSNAVSGETLADSLEWQQQVTDGIGGILAGVVLYTGFVADDLTVSIGLGPGPFTGSFAFTTTALIALYSSGGTFIDTSAADIILTPGEEFVIDVSGGSEPSCCDLAGANSEFGAAYTGGDLFLLHFYSNGNTGGGPIDYTTCAVVNSCTAGSFLAFETFMTPTETPVPEPGSLGLFCLALIGFGAVRRRNTN